MKSRERLLRAFARQPVDRVPCSPRVSAWMMERYKDSGNSGTTNLLHAAREFGFDPHLNHRTFRGAGSLLCRASVTPQLPQVTYQQEEQPDSESPGFRLIRRRFMTPEGELTDVTRYSPRGDRRFGISPDPVRIEYLVKEQADLKRLAYLMAQPKCEDFNDFFETEKQIGEDGLVLLEVLSSLCHRAGDVYPMEEMMMGYFDDRGFVDALLGMFRLQVTREVDAALAAGVKCFFANWYYNSLSTGWSPAIWRDLFKPELEALCTQVHQGGGILNFYDDGKCMPLLEDFADCGADVWQTLCPPPVGDVDLAEAKRRIGDRVCLMGHVDLIYVLQRGTPELIDRTVREAIEIAAPGGGFVLGTSDSIRDGTPIENVRAYFNAAAKYGRAACACA